MEIITGYTGTAHVTADQDRDINIGLCGGGSYVMQTGMQMAAEVSTNNEIKIRDGVIMHQGCAACIKKNTYDSLTINNGSQGMKRIDLIVARYQRNPETGVESLNLLVIQGTPSASDPLSPSGTTGDIQAGDTIADMELYRVHIDGLSIVEVEKLFEVIQSAAELKEMVAELNSKISAAENIKLPIVREFYLDDVSINASSYSSNVRVPIDDIDGYTPYVVGWSMKGASSGGANNTHCFSYNHAIEDYNGIKATFGIRNYAASVAKIKVDATILYIPNI